MEPRFELTSGLALRNCIVRPGIQDDIESGNIIQGQPRISIIFDPSRAKYSMDDDVIDRLIIRNLARM